MSSLFYFLLNGRKWSIESPVFFLFFFTEKHGVARMDEYSMLFMHQTYHMRELCEWNDRRRILQQKNLTFENKKYFYSRDFSFSLGMMCFWRSCTTFIHTQHCIAANSPVKWSNIDESVVLFRRFSYVLSRKGSTTGFFIHFESEKKGEK